MALGGVIDNLRQSLADPRGAPGMLAPLSVKFFSLTCIFREKNGLDNRLARFPCLGNPGFATGLPPPFHSLSAIQLWPMMHVDHCVFHVRAVSIRLKPRG